jgi:pimeloyl-ACP methyl ester carboxylesterase
VAATVFVAHSLGGLIVKQVLQRYRVATDGQAIIEAYNNGEYASLHKAIKGVVFLGTPHRGADLAGLLDLVLLASFSSRRFVKQLNPNSDAIAAINNAFTYRVEPLKLISFYETENTRLQWVTLYKRLGDCVVASDRDDDCSRILRHFGLSERDQAWIKWTSHWHCKVQLEIGSQLWDCLHGAPQTRFQNC